MNLFTQAFFQRWDSSELYYEMNNCETCDIYETFYESPISRCRSVISIASKSDRFMIPGISYVDD